MLHFKHKPIKEINISIQTRKKEAMNNTINILSGKWQSTCIFSDLEKWKKKNIYIIENDKFNMSI